MVPSLYYDTVHKYKVDSRQVFNIHCILQEPAKRSRKATTNCMLAIDIGQRKLLKPESKELASVCSRACE